MPDRPRVATRGRLVAVLLVVGLGVVLTLVLVSVTRAPDLPPVSLGEERTADPCSLISPSALAPFGEVRVDPDQGPLASCLARVGDPGAVTVTVSFYRPGEVPPQPAERSVGSVVVSEAVRYPSGCGRYATLADGTALLVRATDRRSGAPCAIVDAATDAGVGMLTAGAVGRREPDPAAVVARLDACTVIDPDAANAPGVGTDRIQPGYAGASCRFGADDLTAPSLIVTMARRDPEAPTTRIGRHEAVVSPVPGGPGEPGFCEVSLVQREFPSAAGARVDVVEILYSGTPAQDGTALCAVATGLATAAEARLPAPT